MSRDAIRKLYDEAEARLRIAYLYAKTKARQDAALKALSIHVIRTGKLGRIIV